MLPPEDPSRPPRRAAPPRPSVSTDQAEAPTPVGQTAARQTYDEFLRQHHPALLGNARWRCGNAVLGEDLLQDVLLTIWTAIIQGKVDPTTLTPAYVKTGVYYRFLDHLRRQGRIENHHDAVGQWQSRIWDGDDPGERTFDNEEFEQARALLPERHWEIFVLSEAYGFSPTEIGERLELNPRTVSNYLSIARRQIAKIRSVPH